MAVNSSTMQYHHLMEVRLPLSNSTQQDTSTLVGNSKTRAHVHCI